MKRKYFCLFLVLLTIFISCKHNKDNKDENIQIEDTSLVLKELKVHGLGVNVTKQELEIKVPLKISDITKKDIEVQFNIPNISCYVKGDEVVLKEGETTNVVLEVPAKKGKYKAWSKTLKVTREATEETEVKNLLDILEVTGGKVNNQISSKASPDEIKTILEGKAVQIQIASPYAKVILASKKASWSNLVINGEKVQSVLQGDYASVALKKFEFEKVGDIKKVTVELTAKRKTAKFSFEIKRIEGMVDIPDLSLQINKQKYSAVDKDFWAKLHNGSKPIIEGPDPSQIKIECEHDFISSIKINSVDVGVIQNEGNIWYGVGSVEDLNSAGKDVKIEITPKDKNVYHTVVWNFKLKGVDKRKLNIEYYFNGKYIYEIAGNFAQDFYDDRNPLLNIDGSFLNVNLTCYDEKVSSVKVNDEECISKVKINNVGWSMDHSIKLDTELQITIEIIPQDKANFKSTTVKFKAKGNGAKEKIKAQFLINGNSNLPQTTFLEQLENNSNPLYQVFGEEPVKLSFIFDEYQANFHVSKLEIDGQDNLLLKDTNMLNYKVEKDIVINKTTPTNVVVKFIPKKPEMTEETTWKFRLQGGGKLPPIPRNYVPKFYINNIGKPATPFTDDFKEKLVDVDNPPLLTIDGKEINIYLAIFLDNKTDENEILKEVGFIFDSGTEIKKELIKNSPYAEILHSIALPEDNAEHNVKVIMYPKKENEYSELVYAFRVKNSGNKATLPLTFSVNGKEYDNDSRMSFNRLARVTLAVEAELEVMEEVKLNEEVLNIRKFKKNNKSIWRAEKTIDLITEHKEFKFEVKPKDQNAYEKTIHTGLFKGGKTEKKNVDFEYLFEPIEAEVTFFDGNNHPTINYGAKKVILKAHTVSDKSEVWYRITSKDADDYMTSGTLMEKESDYVHKTGNIVLEEDKPTRIIVWIVAENKFTKSKSPKRIVFNDVKLKWDKELKTEGEKFSSDVYTYGIIKVKKAELTDNKMYLAFSIWKDGFAIDDSYAYPSYQDAFEKLEVSGERQWYITSINVSTLNSDNELEVALPILSEGALAFTYKVKIKEEP